jgi:hypothetical protein
MVHASRPRTGCKIRNRMLLITLSTRNRGVGSGLGGWGKSLFFSTLPHPANSNFLAAEWATSANLLHPVFPEVCQQLLGNSSRLRGEKVPSCSLSAAIPFWAPPINLNSCRERRVRRHLKKAMEIMKIHACS